MAGDTPYQRKLATIIAVDVCRYSRLVEADEEGAIRDVDAVRSLIEGVIDSHGGRIFNHAGDGLMAETPSAVEGVRAAFKIHKKIDEFNGGRPDAEPLCVRIGVNLGDVVAKDDGDLAGHGVNIASRLEQIADPGETVISHAVYEQVRGTVEELFKAAGYEKLKNINSPIAVYRAQPDGSIGPLPTPGPSEHGQTRGIPWSWAIGAVAGVLLAVAATIFLQRPNADSPATTDFQTIAILPFKLIGTQADDQHFADGMTEEVRSALGTLDEIRVLGRTTSWAASDDMDALKKLTRTAGLTHVVEGSVRRQSGRVRVSVELLDVDGDVQVWSDTYERQVDDIFLLQEDIARSVAKALGQTLMPTRYTSLPTDRGTYDIFLRGQSLYSQRGGALPQAISYFETAVARDGDFADGWAALASALHVLPAYSDTPYTDIEARAREAAEKSLELNASSAEALAVVAAQTRRANRWPDAEALFIRALELEPNNISCLYYYGEFLLSVGRFNDAAKQFEAAYAIDPLSPYTSAGIGWARYFQGDFEAADAAFSNAWGAFGLKLRTIWEGMYTLRLAQGDIDGARALLPEGPFPREARAVHETFLKLLENPSGMGAGALNMLFSSAERLTGQSVPFYWRYEAFAHLKMPGFALDAAEAAAAAGPIQNTQALFSPGGRAALRDPRFVEVADQLGLVSYWRDQGMPDFCGEAEMRETCDALRG